MTNASDSFDKMKQEMQAIKTTSNAELQAIQKAIKKIESDIQGGAAILEVVIQEAIGGAKAPWSTRR